MKRRAATAIVLLLWSLPSAADDAETVPTPGWAIPKEGPKPAGEPKQEISLPGSELVLSQEQVDDPFDTPDWYPDEHPAMPAIVKHGREPDNWACAMCHLASGGGHPQSARLAGHDADYLARQLEAFKTGDRTSYLGAFIDDLHAIEDDADAERAAAWFASLPSKGFQQVIESETVPETTFEGTSFMRVRARGADDDVRHEPIDGRIIEVPEDYDTVKARSPNSTFLTYVPPGSVESGRKLANDGTRNVAPCTTCHGPGLEGTTLGPALAGSFPTYIVRQLYDFRNGDRRGLADRTGYMGASSSLLTAREVVQLAAYIGSLDP